MPLPIGTRVKVRPGAETLGPSDSEPSGTIVAWREFSEPIHSTWYFIEFDEPQTDSEGDFVTRAQIRERFIEAID